MNDLKALEQLAAAIDAAAAYAGMKTIKQIVAGYENRLTTIVNDAMRTGDFVDMRRAHRALLKNVARDVYRDGLREGGIEPRDESDEDRAATEEVIDDWLSGQLEHVNQFAKDAAEARKDKSKRPEIVGRVALWVDSLRNFGEAGRLAALGNIALTFDGDDGEESCDDCQRYKGQRHRRNWWAERGLLERNGNENYACGRWENCHHSFKDDKGKVIIS